MKHLFTLKSLLLTLVMLCGLNAWGETETFNFVGWKFDGASEWDSNYSKRTISGSAYKVEFASANKNTSTIKDRPVTKGGDIIVSPLSNVTITGVKLTLTQWKTKTQTVTLNVSSDGTTFTATSTKSSKFSLSASELDTKAVKFTFSSSNQVGVESIEVTYTTAGGGEAVTVEKPTFSLAGGTYYAAQEVTIQIPDGADKVMYTTNGDVPSSANSVGVSITENTPITVSETTTIQAIAVDAKGNESAVASATYTIVPSIANTIETALTVAEAKNLIDNTSAEQLADPTQKVYVKGTISSITKLNSDNTITYLLDGDAFTIYHGKGLGEKTFASVDDLAVGASVIVYGNLYYYSATSLYEMNTGNYLVEYTTPAGFVEKPVITETSTPDFGSSYYTTSTATATIASATEGATIQYAITGDNVTDAATIESWTEGATVSITSEVAGTKILWAKAVKDGKESVVASKEFTFTTDVAPEGTYFVLVTDASQIVEGAKYVITSETDDAAMLGWKTGDNNCKPQSVTASNGVLELPSDFTGIITLGKTETGYTLKQLDGLYLTATGTDKNYLVAKSALVDNSYWNITIGSNNVASIKNVNNTSRGVMQYNSSSELFACYSSASQTDIHLYRMAKEVPVATEIGLDAVLAGNVGGKYQIKCALHVNYKDANYVYASTTKGGSTKTAPTEAQKKEWWSDIEDKFNQNDWVAIQGLDVVEGAEIEAGSVSTLVSNSEFPVIKFDSMKTADGTAIAANTYRVANFNIGNISPLVSKLWLVAPQPAEYCKVKGYVDATTDVKTNYLFAKTGSEATVIEGTSYEPLKMTVNLDAANEKITESGWYVFEGIVIKNGTIRELNAISATVGSIETGVEGVETSSVKVYGAEGVINVESEEVAPIAVYSANGAIVSSVEASSASIAVAPGFYIVKAGNSVSKVTVK